MNFELLKTLTVLYAEDESHLRKDIYRNLIPFIKDIILATDGKKGLKLYLQNRGNIDLIISDILMPNMSGIEMNDKIREIDSKIPIIYTTAFDDSSLMKKTISQSITDYIVKPIDIELLLKGIQKASLSIENEKLKKSLAQANQLLEERIHLKTKELIIKNRELQHQLVTDDLTSLKNRKSFFKDIKQYKNPVIYLIDIDSFKTINDLYGETIGNFVLLSISDILKNSAKEKNFTPYRMGSNEFILLSDEIFDKTECVDFATSLIKKIKLYKFYNKEYDIVLRIDVTIGISADKTDTLVKADMALKRAKAKKVRSLLYEDRYSLQDEYKNDIKWSAILENSLKNDEIMPFYQPIVDKYGKVIKYESLVRVVKDGKVYPPYLFLDIAKKIKLYHNLEKNIITQVFDMAQKYQIGFSVNLSIEDILNDQFIEYIEKNLVEKDIAPLITFEILESESIEDYEKVIYFIKHVKYLGSTIAIDDFGSGYSNFAYLLKLKPDYIKLDGSFIKNIDKDKNSYLIAQTINDFAHTLKIKTIAEFVHSKSVFEIVKRLGIDEFQGYYFSEPLKNLQP